MNDYVYNTNDMKKFTKNYEELVESIQSSMFDDMVP